MALKNKPEYTNNLPYLVDFITKYGDKAAKWGKETIKKRAEDLATIAYNKIWSL